MAMWRVQACGKVWQCGMSRKECGRPIVFKEPIFQDTCILKRIPVWIRMCENSWGTVGSWQLDGCCPNPEMFIPPNKRSNIWMVLKPPLLQTAKQNYPIITLIISLALIIIIPRRVKSNSVVCSESTKNSYPVSQKASDMKLRIKELFLVPSLLLSWEREVKKGLKHKLGTSRDFSRQTQEKYS